MKDRETGDDYWFPNIIREVEVARSQSLQQTATHVSREDNFMYCTMMQSPKKQ